MGKPVVGQWATVVRAASKSCLMYGYSLTVAMAVSVCVSVSDSGRLEYDVQYEWGGTLARSPLLMCVADAARRS